MKYSESDIIKCLYRQDSSCVKMLFDNYYQTLCIFALRYLDSFADVEDVVQDIFVSFWENKKGCRFEGSLRGYLFGAVRKRALKLLHESGRLVLEDIENHVNFLLEESENPSEEELKRRTEKLYGAIAHLPDKCRIVFTAIVLDDLQYKEVAEKLGVSVNTVKTHYSRALRQLREHLDTLLLLFLRF